VVLPGRRGPAGVERGAPTGVRRSHHQMIGLVTSGQRTALVAGGGKRQPRPIRRVAMLLRNASDPGLGFLQDE